MNKELKRKKLTQQANKILLNCRVEDLKYLTVGWVARKLGVSVPNLSRAYKQETGGLLLKHHIFMTKMIICQHLVEEEPDITVKELAARLDYSSSKYFIKVFKKYSMMTPGTYIKLNKIAKELHNVHILPIPHSNYPNSL